MESSWGRSGIRSRSGNRAATRPRICDGDSDSVCANPFSATWTAAAGDISVLCSSPRPDTPACLEIAAASRTRR